MGKRDLKQNLLELLREDYDLQEAIKNICRQEAVKKDKYSYGQSTSSSYTIGGKASLSALGRTEKDYADEIKKLKEKLADQEQKLLEQNGLTCKLQMEAENYKDLLAEAERKNNDLRWEANSEKQEKLKLKAELQNAHAEAQRLGDSAARLERECRQLQEENQEQRKMLSQRFARGWELFSSYQKVSKQSKEMLDGVFVKADDFASFICGGAQDNSLGVIWDVIKGCLSRGNTEDAEILWDIFEYDMELVNSTKTTRIYALLEVEPGTPFDLDVHTLAAGSRAQGDIKDVYLQGYMNVYANRVERKSIVRV